MYTLPSRPFLEWYVGVCGRHAFWRNRKNTFTFLFPPTSVHQLFRCAINYTFLQGIITFDLSKIHNHKCLVLSSWIDSPPPPPTELLPPPKTVVICFCPPPPPFRLAELQLRPPGNAIDIECALHGQNRSRLLREGEVKHHHFSSSINKKLDLSYVQGNCAR